MIINGQHIRNALIDTFVWTRTTWVYHTLFWVLFYASLMYFEDQNQPVVFRSVIEFVNLFFYVVLVYFNIFFLIPNYLTGKRLWIYLIMLVLTCLILTPLKLLVFFVCYNHSPEIQEAMVMNQRWYFSTLLLMGGASTVYSIIADWKKQEKEQSELQNKTIESELRFLKTQINPHFLFNTLNSLYALTLKKSDDAPEVVLQLSEMMRYMLYDCNEPMVLLSKEVNYIENYLKLEQLRMKKNANIKFIAEGDISTQRVAPLLFIPFIENTFKHGASNQIKEIYIYITLKIIDGQIAFTCENNKPEVLPNFNTGKKSGGIGLVNVKRRLDLLYPEKNHLKIADSPDSYKVELTIDL